MSKTYQVIALATLATIASIAAHADEATCIANFKTTGSFFSGKQYQTWLTLGNVVKNDAYTKIYGSLVKDGWKIGQTDKEVGVITASQEVSYGEGKNAPLNILIETEGAQTKATATFTTSGGVAAKAANVQKSLCGYLTSAETK
jgi:hypothetical protein